MLEYLGMEFLEELAAYYRSRYCTALERGFDKESNRYHWLYLELKERLLVIYQLRHFLNVLPAFMSGAEEKQIFKYVMSYSTALFKAEPVTSIKRSEDNVHPFFNNHNPYWCQLREVQDSIDCTYDTANLPLLYIDLCEYSIRCLRLYLQIREQCAPSIDRGKFDAVMKLTGSIPSTA